MTRKKAEKLRALIEQAVISLPDKEASDGAELFPQLNGDGSLIPNGTRINWNGVVKKATVDLWDTEENNPDNAPTLWKDIYYRDGYRIIPEVITVTTMFSKGECGWWGDVLYESVVDNNAYTPEQYASNWVQVHNI
jgi:hypothetical protein